MKIFLAAGGCVVVPGVYSTPTDAFAAAKTAIRDNRRMDFLGTLSSDTLSAYEHAVLLAWPEVRDAYGFMANDSAIVSVEPVVPTTKAEAGKAAEDPAWVWPTDSLSAVKLTLRVTWEGEQFLEPILLVEEELPAQDNVTGSKMIRIGEQWFVRERHPNPDRYELPSQGPTKGWRLLIPYQPFQGQSKLARKIAEAHQKAESPPER